MSTEEGTSHDVERMPASKENSHSVAHRVQVRTPKESRQERGTHFLSNTKRMIHQDTKRMPVSKGHSLPVEWRWGDKSRHQTSQQVKGTHSLSSAKEGTS